MTVGRHIENLCWQHVSGYPLQVLEILGIDGGLDVLL